MGCAAESDRSMIDSLRCPSPTRASLEIHVPAPSGPRCSIVSRMRSMKLSVIVKREFVNDSAPVMPHMDYAPQRELCSRTLDGIKWLRSAHESSEKLGTVQSAPAWYNSRAETSVPKPTHFIPAAFAPCTPATEFSITKASQAGTA